MSTELFEAVKSGDTSKVLSLLDHDASLLNASDDNGLCAVLVATYCHQNEVADLLIDRGSSLDIFAAAAAGRVDRVRVHLEADASLAHAYSSDGWTALHLAVHFGHKEAARVLVEAGADLAACSRNSLGNTPLHAAIASLADAEAGLLLAAGADIDALDAEGNTPLHLVAAAGESDVMKLLLVHGAEVNIRNNAGKTPITLAEEGGHDSTVTMLDAYGGEA